MDELTKELIAYGVGLPLALVGLGCLARIYLGFKRPRPRSFLLLIGAFLMLAISGESSYTATVLRHHQDGMLTVGQGNMLRAFISSSYILGFTALLGWIATRKS